MTKPDKPTKLRYHVIMPESLYEEVKNAAEVRATTIVELMRRLLRVGLVVLKASEEGCALVIRDKDGKTERQIEFL